MAVRGTEGIWARLLKKPGPYSRICRNRSVSALSRATVASATVRTAAAIIQAPFMCTKSALYEAAGCGGDDGGGGAGMVVSSTVYTK